MLQKINHLRKVAVLGSGVMGSQIAAHCVNAGLEVWLLDLKNKENGKTNKLVYESIKKLSSMKPAPMALPGYAKRIHPGNFEDDLDILGEMDWICEAVVEQLDIKKDMMQKIDEHRNKDSLVSSNTSGLPIHKLSEGRSDDFKKHFLGTHFFNPPRYMKLLELIPTDDTDPEIAAFIKRFAEEVLGKGVVTCKDTPNFIANRIGVFSMASILPYYFKGVLRAEEIDLLTGTLTGYSKAATFRTADMVGLDVLKHVADNLYPEVTHDERREIFKLPETFEKMVDEGLIGNKAGKGFYKKVRTEQGKQYLVLKPEIMEYEKQQEVKIESVQQAKAKYSKAGDRLKYLVNKEDRAGEFLWNIHCDLLLYAAHRIPEITESTEAIDRAMKWGFNWELGPFERWDAIGVEASVQRMKEDGRDVPASVEDMLLSGRQSFYDHKEGTIYNLATGEVEPLSAPAEGALQIPMLKAGKKDVFINDDAGLYNMGDGVALFEFRSAQNTLGRGVVESLNKALDTVYNDFDALVIGNEGANFSYGANLKEALTAIQKEWWSDLKSAVQNFQEVSTRLRNAPFPVVVAPFNRTLGGGTEFSLRADKVVAHQELYAGLVEVGVGLIPAGGGTTEMLRRFMNRVSSEDNADPLTHLKEVFKIIGMATVSDSAPKARKIGYLSEKDVIVMNRDLLLKAAKEEAHTMAEVGYQPPAEPEIELQGRTGYANLKLTIYILRESGYLTEYDAVVAEKLAHVLTGGDLSEPQKVPESYVHKLEREAFMELIKDERTQKRIEHMLKTGKPLRN